MQHKALHEESCIFVYDMLIPSLTILCLLFPVLVLALFFTGLWLLFTVMLADVLLVVMQSGLSSHAIGLHLVSWLCWMGVTMLLPPCVTI